MRKVSAVVVVLALLLVQPLRAQDWKSSGLVVGPIAANQVLVDSGPLALNGFGGEEGHPFTFVIASNVTAVILLQKVDADGTTVLTSQALIVNAFTSYSPPRVIISVLPGQHIRLTSALSLVTGSLWASIFQE